MFVHAPEHSSSPLPEHTHVEPWQVEPVGHLLLHAPQLFESVVVSTH
jgi:hypothetical protein